MPVSQENVSPDLPLGATLVDGGAVFRAWAPAAQEVYLVLNRPITDPDAYQRSDAELLTKDRSGIWSGFMAGAKDGDLYRFYVVGPANAKFKRDPYARELEPSGHSACNCVLRARQSYRWHDAGFRPPAFSELIIYQFHIGVFYAKNEAGEDIRSHRVCQILDVVDRIEYLADLGVNAVMPLPLQEYQGENSLGYNGTDLFSPERDYAVPVAKLAPYVARINRLRAAKGVEPLADVDLAEQINQLKAFVDLCHLYGIAVIADVVYNHAGPGFDDQCMKFFDCQPETSWNNSLYFTEQDHAGGRVFAFWRREVCRFLIDNAKSLLEEYHIDGLRYDQVTVIAQSGGWYFAQDLTNSVRSIKPEAVQIAEFWDEPGSRWQGVASPPKGMGFDIGYSDTLRDAVRDVIGRCTGGRNAHVSLQELRGALGQTHRYPGRWSVFQCLENHDLLYVDHQGKDRQPRLAALADPTNARSWYARSRAKVATGLLLTAPGVPMLFMGQEFLEDKYWTDWSGRSDLLIWWDGLDGKDKHMSDQHRFTRELIALRRRLPGLRGDGLNVFHAHDDNRVIAFHRWVPDEGHDIVVVASLNETTFHERSYRIGLPVAGQWNELFNSDVYDDWFNPNVQGNPGGVRANGPAWDGLPASGTITLPANSLLVFALDRSA